MLNELWFVDFQGALAPFCEVCFRSAANFEHLNEPERALLFGPRVVLLKSLARGASGAAGQLLCSKA